jgi:hypothetical protein
MLVPIEAGSQGARPLLVAPDKTPGVRREAAWRSGDASPISVP